MSISGVGTVASGTGEASAVREGAVVEAAAARVLALSQEVLGSASVGAGLLLVGAANERKVRESSERKKRNEGVDVFMITAPEST